MVALPTKHLSGSVQLSVGPSASGLNAGDARQAGPSGRWVRERGWALFTDIAHGPLMRPPIFTASNCLSARWSTLNGAITTRALWIRTVVKRQHTVVFTYPIARVHSRLTGDMGKRRRAPLIAEPMGMGLLMWLVYPTSANTVVAE